MKLAALVLPVLLTAAGARAGLAERATLWVEVVSADTGAPLEGVRIVLTKAGVRNYSVESVGPLDGGRGKAPTTGSDGRARFRLYPRAYSLHVSWHAEGRWIDVPELRDGEVRTLRVELPTEDDVVLRGRVLARVPGAASEAPLSGAEILVYEGDSWGTRWPLHQASGVVTEIARTSTDADGAFEVRSASWKRRMVRIRAPGVVTGYLAIDPRGDREVVVRLGPAATLLARVEQPGGLPPGSRIGLSMKRCAALAWSEIAADGTARLEGVPADEPLRVTVRWPEPRHEEPERGLDDSCLAWFSPHFPHHRLVNRVPGRVVLAPGEIASRTFSLPAPCALTGIARDALGRPLAGVELHLVAADDLETTRTGMRPRQPVELPFEKFPDVVVTDGEGAFRIEHLPGNSEWYLGPYGGSAVVRRVLEADPDEFVPVPKGIPVTLPVGATEHRIELRLP